MEYGGCINFNLFIVVYKDPKILIDLKFLKFFLTYWRHKRLKNKIDLLLFYRGHFYGFSEKDR